MDRGKSIGEKIIAVMESGSGGNKTKKIKLIVYRKPTLAKGHPVYWFQLRKGVWKNTTRKGIKDGIVVSKEEFMNL